MTAPLTAHETAAELGISYDHFMRTRAEMEARGFPRPLRLIGLSRKGRGKGRPPLRWDADLIAAWKRGEDVAPHVAANDASRIAPRDLRKLKELFG